MRYYMLATEFKLKKKRKKPPLVLSSFHSVPIVFVCFLKMSQILLGDTVDTNKSIIKTHQPRTAKFIGWRGLLQPIRGCF